jgi:hypothetical protein
MFLQPLSLVLLLFSLPQQPPAPAPALQFRISGIVVNAVNGQPISRAQVSIGSPKLPDSPRTVSASDDGRFVFENLPVGTYQLTARRKGYIQQAYKQHESFSTGIVVGPDLNTDNLRLELRPAASLSGQIFDEMNDPVRNAQVNLLRQGLRSGRLATWRQGQITTDDEGHYHFGYLAPGNYLVAVSAQPWYAQQVPRLHTRPDQTVSEGVTRPDPVDPAFDVTYPVTFFSNARDISGASPITLHPGDAATVDITLQPIPALHLIIRSPSPGEPNQSERFWANITQPLGDGLEEHVQARSQEIAPGVIEVSGLPPGRFTLALNSSKGNESTTRSQVLQVIQDAEINASEALPSSSISGVIKKDDGSPFSRPTNLQFRSSTTRTVLVAQVDLNGEFALKGQNAMPGTYEVTVAGAVAIRSLTADGAKVSGHSVEIGPGQNVRVSVVVSEGSGQVKGFALKDGKPMDGVMIVLVPQDPERNRELFRRDQSDSDGSFNLSGILPGKYTLIALENAWDSDWSSPGFLQKYLAAGEPVQISANDKLQFKVQVQP